jgi:hypothetical protein
VVVLVIASTMMSFDAPELLLDGANRKLFWTVDMQSDAV